MISRNLRTITNRTFKAITSGQRSYSSFDRDFYHLASAIIRDFDSGPSVFYEPTVYYRQPVHSTFEQKTITSDENGRIFVRTQRKVPGRAWETYVEEYVSDKSVEQSKKPEAIGQKHASTASQTGKSDTTNEQTIEQPISEPNKTTETADPSNTTATTTPQNSTQQTASAQASDVQPTCSNSRNMLSLFDQHFQQLSDSMMRDFDHFFGTRHPLFSNSNSRSRWFESEIDMDMIDTNSNATYHAKTIINDNGNVTVKTVSKQPGSAWETSVKHYGQNGTSEECQQKTEAIDNANGNLSDQKTSEKIDKSVKEDQHIRTETEQAASR